MVRLSGSMAGRTNSRLPRSVRFEDQLRTIQDSSSPPRITYPDGGPPRYTWFDRDLGLAGRVLVRSPDGGPAITHRLVKIDRPILRIPMLAIHLQRDIHTAGFKPNLQVMRVPAGAGGARGEPGCMLSLKPESSCARLHVCDCLHTSRFRRRRRTLLRSWRRLPRPSSGSTAPPSRPLTPSQARTPEPRVLLL